MQGSTRAARRGSKTSCQCRTLCEALEETAARRRKRHKGRQRRGSHCGPRGRSSRGCTCSCRGREHWAIWNGRMQGSRCRWWSRWCWRRRGSRSQDTQMHPSWVEICRGDRGGTRRWRFGQRSGRHCTSRMWMMQLREPRSLSHTQCKLLMLPCLGSNQADMQCTLGGDVLHRA